MLSNYWVEFATIAIVHLVAVVSPGPDFAIVVKNSIAYGRRIAYATSIGIGVGILLHVAYSLIGISLLIKTTPWLYQTVSYIAAAYLLWLAWGAIRSKPTETAPVDEQEQTQETDTPSWLKAFWIGFLTNGLNPKATLFFMSVFTVVISATTPLQIQMLYGIYLAIATGTWFCCLSFLLSTNTVLTFIGDKGYLLDRAMGVLLIVLAANLIVFQPM